MTLTEFLLARIAEDEATARMVWERPHFGYCNTQGDLSSLGDECTCGLPARVLAECEAKRAIVAWAELVLVDHANEQTGATYELIDAQQIVLEHLAAPHAQAPRLPAGVDTVKRLTYLKTRRAIDALADLIECADTTPSERRELDKACDYIRGLGDRAKS